jgi:hypothetical protein
MLTVGCFTWGKVASDVDAKTLYGKMRDTNIIKIVVYLNNLLLIILYLPNSLKNGYNPFVNQTHGTSLVTQISVKRRRKAV